MQIDAKGVYYRQLNERIREAIEAGETEIELVGVNGQRYIGGGIKAKGVTISINGVPGNDLATFMNGPTVIVNNNAQDGCGNTMNAGKIVVHGDAGDVLGYGMRGGRLFVRGDVGYRVGIHMKAYETQVPVIVAGGIARDFLGEYMAGGILVVLGIRHSNGNGGRGETGAGQNGGVHTVHGHTINGHLGNGRAAAMNGSNGTSAVGNWAGTGMHGGKIYVRGGLEEHQLGREVKPFELTGEDREELDDILTDYCDELGVDYDEVMSEPFVKLIPYTHRPYGKMYAY
ncbi:MAG: hypothetical protein C4521_04925 [Actinobacteria bacterium]|nr:MAG: hypothetical protein C4521_04925 [Actinomycetota bacterium]